MKIKAENASNTIEFEAEKHYDAMLIGRISAKAKTLGYEVRSYENPNGNAVLEAAPATLFYLAAS